MSFAVVAATHEEAARLVIVCVIAYAVPRQFNDPMDRIICGSIAGLGMAVSESVMYLTLTQPKDALLGSEFVRLFVYPVLGVIVGFPLGMKRMKMARWGSALVGCMAVAVTIHFLWDWIVLSARGAMQWWQTISVVLLMAGGVLFYGVLVGIGAEWSRQTFAPRSKLRLWGWPLTILVQQNPGDRS